MINTRTVTGRRPLRFETLEEIVADAEMLASGEVRTVGNWTFGQILQHLADSTNAAFDGFGFRAPWFARTFVVPFIKNRVITEPAVAGIPIPVAGQRLLPDLVEVEPALARLKAALARFQTEPPTAPHPLLGSLATQEWRQMCQRHAELHLSFVAPAR